MALGMADECYLDSGQVLQPEWDRQPGPQVL
jgi:hypothetical protein